MADTKEQGALGMLRESAARNPATERLMHEAQEYAAARAQAVVTGLGHRLGEATTRLAEGNLKPGALLTGGKKLAEGKSPKRAAVEMGAQGLKDSVKDKVKGLFGKLRGKGRGKGSGGPKIINIVEDVDVGVPVREAYNQWTQFQEFSGFAKGVKSVEAADDTSSNWKMKVFWSNRSWKANTVEQVPDQRIAWTSDGAKGTTKGAVTFHPLGENLTKVLLVIEYYPKGLFEKTGNIWRAQGRRARLDLKNFRRFVMIRGEATGGWRGEIRDGEVVREHEEAVEEEERQQQEEQEKEEQRVADERGEREPREEENGDEKDEDFEDEGEDFEDFEDEDEEFEDEEPEEDLEDEEPEPEPEPEPRPRRRARARAR